jgi:hypothetical protein
MTGKNKITGSFWPEASSAGYVCDTGRWTDLIKTGASCSRTVTNDMANCWYGHLDPFVRQDLAHLVCDVCDQQTINQYRPIALDSLRSRIADYFHGAGLVINPLPQEPAQFYESDVEAMRSDWDNVLVDAYSVLKAADIMKSIYEQPIGRTEPAIEAGNTERTGLKAST